MAGPKGLRAAPQPELTDEQIAENARITELIHGEGVLWDVYLNGRAEPITGIECGKVVFLQMIHSILVENDGMNVIPINQISYVKARKKE